MAIRYLTAGESHGKMLVGILENVPAGLYIDPDFVKNEGARRKLGYGRGGRMKIESDEAEFVTGVRAHRSLGSPITAVIFNNDFAVWNTIMGENAVETDKRTLTAVRPGHADLSGAVKYGFSDARNVLERASARETAMRVALGAVAKLYLKELGISIASHTVAIGNVRAKCVDCADINATADRDPVRCLDVEASKKMTALIDEARAAGDTLGGVTEIIVMGCKSGIGSYVSEDRKLDGLIMSEVGTVQSVKAVEIGDGIISAASFGSCVHDEIYYTSGKSNGLYRKTNRAGGIEGGMTNGERIVVRAYLKPVPTLMRGLNTVDIATGKPAKAAAERSDACVVAAGGVVCEAAVALALATSLSEMLGGDTMEEVIARYGAKRSVYEL